MARRVPGPRSPWAHAAWGVRLMRDTADGLTRLAERYGPICATGVGPIRYVYLFGPEAHRELFISSTERFSWRAATKSLIPVDGDTALIVSDGEDHRRRRRLVQPAFNIRRIDAHIPLMVEEAGSTVGAWRTGTEVDAYEELRRCVRRIVIRALFGEGLRERADEFGDLLEPALEFVNLAIPQQIRVDLPWTRWHRAKRARRETDALVFAEIDRRRREPAGGKDEDVLSWLLAASEEDDVPLSDQEVRDQVISLIAAGYDTTSAGIGWTLFAALDHPGVWDHLRGELDEHLGDAPLTADGLRQLTYLDAVVSESLRLWPPGIIAGRRTEVPLSVAGYEVRPGTLVFYSPYVTHRLPAVWPDPLAFRPERWDRDTPDYQEPASYSYVPFGAGPRQCLGFAFALTEIKVLLAELVRRVDLDLLVADPGRAGLASMRPRAGVPVRVASVRPAGVTAG